MGFLTDLTDGVRRDLARSPLDADALAERAATAQPTRDLERALRSGAPAFIAEVKRASPSTGVIAEGRDPREQAAAYLAGGASAISVLTESRHFLGSLGDLQAVRGVVDIPVLRKDFLLAPSQLLEARTGGADAVLLIASCLTDEELATMLHASETLGLGVLLETHSDEDLSRALATDARVIGVNARDLETLEVDVPAALVRLGRISGDRVAVLESGISTRADVLRAVERGASAILVGEALMRAPDPTAELLHLRGQESQP